MFSWVPWSGFWCGIALGLVFLLYQERKDRLRYKRYSKGLELYLELRRTEIIYWKALAFKAPFNGLPVDSVRKTLAIRYHPDKGGSTLAMQAVNEFADMLTKGK
jgi:hypothetical protein